MSKQIRMDPAVQPARSAYRLDDVLEEHTPVYRCPCCHRWRPWDNGCTDGDECDECWWRMALEAQVAHA